MTYRVEVLEQLSCGGLHYSVHHITHKIFQSLQQIVKGNEGTFGFDVSVPEHREEIKRLKSSVLRCYIHNHVTSE